MTNWRWKTLLAVSVVAMLAVVAAVALASAPSHHGSLTGRWSGSIERKTGGHAQRKHLLVVVNASERGGRWRVSAACHGPLVLKDISNGYHHYWERLAPGATCRGGGIDCLKPVAGGVLDEFQPQPATNSYYSSATLHRVARS